MHPTFPVAPAGVNTTDLTVASNHYHHSPGRHCKGQHTLGQHPRCPAGFGKYLLNTHNMPVTVLGAWKISVNKRNIFALNIFAYIHARGVEGQTDN